MLKNLFMRSHTYTSHSCVCRQNISPEVSYLTLTDVQCEALHEPTFILTCSTSILLLHPPSLSLSLSPLLTYTHTHTHTHTHKHTHVHTLTVKTDTKTTTNAYFDDGLCISDFRRPPFVMTALNSSFSRTLLPQESWK